MFLAIIKVALSGLKDLILWPFKFLADLFKTNPKVAIGIIAAILLGIAVWRAEVYVKGLNTQITTSQKAAADATAEKVRIQGNMDIVQELNRSNQEVIAQMKLDAELNKKRIADLNTKVEANGKKYSDLITKINNTPKEQDGPIAKVLSDTIKEIQAQRTSK